MNSASIGRSVARHPEKVVAIIILMTIIFGYYAGQMHMTSDYHSFMPDNEMSRAYNEIQEDYAGVETVQIIQKGGNVLSKDALLEELRLEKELLSDGQIKENLQTPDDPSKSVFSVADMVVYMDAGGKAFAKFAESVINASRSMKEMENFTEEMNGALSYYLYLYGNDSSSDAMNSTLIGVYHGISQFLGTYSGMDYEISPPSFSMSMSVDERISYLENMSDDEISNILRYGTPLNQEEYFRLMSSFQSSFQAMMETIPALSSSSETLSINLNAALSTEPVLSNYTINYTFTEASHVFDTMSTALSSMYGQMMEMMGSMSSSQMSSGYDRMKVMISKDFDPEMPRASATMMVINLNGTQKQGESEDEFTDRMTAVHMRIKDTALSFKGNESYMVMSMRLMNNDLQGVMNETSTTLLPAAFILVIIILLIIFRNITDTVLGLFGLFMAITWTYGFGVMADMTFNQISTTVAVLIVGLGIDYAIHTIMRYREEIRAGKDVKKAVISMETHLGMALILATVTTIVSFLSNLSSPIPPLRDFGMMNAFGIFSAFVINLTFVPAVKVILDRRKERRGKKIVKERGRTTESGVVILNKILAIGAIGAEKHPYKVLAIVAIISLAGIYGGMNLGTEFSETDFLPENTSSYHTLTYIMDNFDSSGMEYTYVLIKGDLTSPELLRSIEDVRTNMADDTYVSLSESEDLTTLIRDVSESNSTFASMVHSLDRDGDGLPDSSISQVYDWLYAHDERTKYLLYRDDGRYVSTIMRVKGTSTKNSEHRVLYSELNADMGPLRDAGYSAVVTGGSLLVYKITTSLQNSQWNSLIVTLIISLIILSAVFYYLRRSMVLGTLTTLPVVIALIWSLGTMYLVGLNFNMMTVTITALTIGLGITYSIHLSHRFLEELDGNSPEEAARTSVRHTGSAIFGAAATTMGGFGVLMLSSMPPMRQFGEIATISILFSFLLSVFILPTFLVLWARHRGNYGQESKRG